jgi:hypothetical protein
MYSSCLTDRLLPSKSFQIPFIVSFLSLSLFTLTALSALHQHTHNLPELSFALYHAKVRVCRSFSTQSSLFCFLNSFTRPTSNGNLCPTLTCAAPARLWLTLQAQHFRCYAFAVLFKLHLLSEDPIHTHPENFQLPRSFGAFGLPSPKSLRSKKRGNGGGKCGGGTRAETVLLYVTSGSHRPLSFTFSVS